MIENVFSRLCLELYWHYDSVDYAQWSDIYLECFRFVLYALCL